MDPTTQPRPTALGQVRERRRQLHHALVQLEAALTVAAGRPAEWRDAVATALARLRSALDDHVAGTEEPGGLFEQVIGDEPRLERRVGQLTDEHGRLRESTEALMARCRGQVPTEEDVTHIREQALELLRSASRHRQRGADLLYEAYEVDLSAGD